MFQLSFQDTFSTPKNRSSLSSSQSLDLEPKPPQNAKPKLKKSQTITENNSNSLQLKERQNSNYSQSSRGASKTKKLSFVFNENLNSDSIESDQKHLNISHIHLSPDIAKTEFIDTKENASPNRSMNESMYDGYNSKKTMNTTYKSQQYSKFGHANVNIDTFIEQIMNNSLAYEKGIVDKEFNLNLIKNFDTLVHDLDLVEYEKKSLARFCCIKENKIEKVLKLKTDKLNLNRKHEIFKKIQRSKTCDSWVFKANMNLIDLYLMADLLSKEPEILNSGQLMGIYEVVANFTDYFFKRLFLKHSKEKIKKLEPSYLFFYIQKFLIQEL